MVPSALPVIPRAQHVSATKQLWGTRNLYVTSASPYFFNEYHLPLNNPDASALTETGVNEPIPIVDDGRDLYVGSFDDGTIFTYPVPLTLNLRPRKGALAATAPQEPFYIPPVSGRHPAQPSGELATNGGIPSGLADLSGLAVSGRYLYVAGASRLGSEVLEYRLPFVSGERPSGSVTGFSAIDFLGIAARNHALYIASTTAGTVGAYRLPLRKDEAPTYTIPTIPQTDGTANVAVDGDGGHLYVSLYAVSANDLYEYRLPYRYGESPKSLSVKSQTGGELPYGLAVSANHLFVGASSEIVSYRLPFTSRTTPEAMIPFPLGNASDVAVGK